MKKLLSCAFALAMGATFAAGLVACSGGGDSGADAAEAKAAIETIATTYGAKSAETIVSYSVLGQTRVEDKTYSVTWKATSENENLDNYVSIGELNTTSKTYPVTITLGEEKVDYKLTASITVGKATETAEFNWYVPVGGKLFTPAEANTEGKKLADKDYYQENGEIVPIRVAGYVVDAGTFDEDHSNFNKIYIADDPSKTKDDADAFYVYRVIPDGFYLKKDGDLKKGDYATFRGYLQRYGSTIELTYYGKGNVYCVGISAAELTDADIVAAAKEKVALYPTLFYQTTTKATLADKSGQANLTWEVTTDTDLVSISGGKLNIDKLPTEDTDIVITATIEYGTAKDTKDLTITVAPELGLAHAGTQADPYTAADANRFARTLANGAYSDKIFVRGYVVDAGEWSAQYNNWNKVYIADEADGEDTLYVYRIVTDERYLKAEGDLVVGDIVTLTGYLNNYEGTLELNYKGSDSITCVGIENPNAGDADKAQQAADDAAAALPGTLKADFDLPASSQQGVELTFTSSNTTALEVSGGKLVVHRAAANVTVTVTVSADCNGTVKTATADVVVKRNFPTDEVANGNVASTTLEAYALAHDWVQGNGNAKEDDADYPLNYDTVDVDKNITVTATGTAVGSYGLNTGKFYSNQEWRMYQTENPSITFTAKNNATILTIKVTYTISNGGVLTTKDNFKTQYTSGTVINVDDTTITFTVGNNDNKTNGQVKIKAIEVVYSGGEGLTPQEKVDKAKADFQFTDTSYDATVIGKPLPTDAGDASITVKWTVSDNNEQADDFVEISTDNKLTIKKLPDNGTKSITLVVTFTIADTEASATKNFTITLVASNAPGTASTPYTVAEAVNATNALASGGYSATAVYVTGYVIVLGSYSTKYENWTGTYIADSMDSTTSSPDAIQIYGLCLDDVYLKTTDDLVLGIKITVHGFLKNHNGNTPEITYDTNKTVDVKVVAMEAVSNATKVKLALKALKNSLPNVVTAEDVTLPTSTVDGVTFTWESDDTETYKAENDNGTWKLRVPSLPTDKDKTVTLTATAVCDGVSENNTKPVTVIIKADDGNDDDDPTPVTYVASEQGYEANKALTAEQLTWVNGKITIEFNKGTNSTAPSYYTSSPSGVRLYGGSYFTVSVPTGYSITKIEITSKAKGTANSLTAEGGSFDSTTSTNDYTSTWTGSAASVKFTVGSTTGNNGIQKVIVTFVKNN